MNLPARARTSHRKIESGVGWRHPHYVELLETLPPLGFLEVHSENFFAAGGAALALLRKARQHYPISLHGVGLGLGSATGIDDWHLDQLARLVEVIDPVRVSDHACFGHGYLHHAGNNNTAHAADLLPLPFNNASLHVMCSNVQRVQDRLRRPLLVENLSAYLSLDGSDRDEATFLRELVQHTGCGLLVDVNNIYVNALNERIAGTASAIITPLKACLDWLDLLPPAAVGEVHVAGHLNCGDIVIDDHGSRVCDEVWQIYNHAQSRFGAVPALVEWDTAIPPLQVLLDEAARANSQGDRVASVGS
jgi:hypothetical protein